jgi:hypothetical protein
VQKWDFRPGSNFVLEMQRAAAGCKRTIAVLSPDYLRSAYGAPEWAAAFASDPEGLKRKLVPVRVAECKPEGLLKTTVYIDLVGFDEDEAQHVLLEGVAERRAAEGATFIIIAASCVGNTMRRRPTTSDSHPITVTSTGQPRVHLLWK